MAYIQKTLPPPEKVENFTLNNFTGGIDNATSDTLLAINKASDILNMAFNEEGTMEKRAGTAKYDPFLYNGAIRFIDNFKSKDGEKLIVCTDTKLYVDKVEKTTVNKPISGVNYLNAYYFVDGVSLKVYGKMPQVGSTNIIITGTPVNDYKIFTIVNPPAFTPLPAPAVIGKWQYNYTTSQIWYEPCAAEIADQYKGTNLLPATPTVIALHGDRLYMNGDAVNAGNVFITDIQNAFYFPVSLPLQMPPNGQEITGLKVFMDSVVVGRKTDINVIYGNTNRTTLSSGLYNRKNINVHCGFANNNTIQRVHDFLFYLGDDGIVYRMNTTQTNVEILSTKPISKDLKLDLYPFNLTLAEIRGMSSLFYNDMYWLFNKNITLVYSYNAQAWTLYKGVSLNCATVIADKIVFGSENGYTYTTSETYDDDDMPYACYWAGKRLDFGLASNYKQIRDIYIVAHVYDDFKSNIKVRYEVDYVDIQQTADITNQITKWGTAQWGDRFITRNITPSLPINIGRRGRKLRIVIMNGYTVKTVFATYANMIATPSPVAGDLYKALDVNKFYLYNLGEFTEISRTELFQPMKIYEINGEYQIKNKR